MLRNTITALAAFAALSFIGAPAASAEITLPNIDVAGIDIPIPSWSGYVPGGPHPYKTGYNISPRYEFRTDPVTGDRRAKFDNGCNGSC